MEDPENLGSGMAGAGDNLVKQYPPATHQFLEVPYITDFVIEYEIRPGLTLFSVFLAYAFPVFVGTYSAVAVRYKGRRMEAIATLHDRCPDPVFRAESSGRIAEAGSDTRHFLDKYGVDYAQKILGEELWARIAANQRMADRPTVFFEPH